METRVGVCSWCLSFQPVHKSPVVFNGDGELDENAYEIDYHFVDGTDFVCGGSDSIAEVTFVKEV